MHLHSSAIRNIEDSHCSRPLMDSLLKVGMLCVTLLFVAGSVACAMDKQSEKSACPPRSELIEDGSSMNHDPGQMFALLDQPGNGFLQPSLTSDGQAPQSIRQEHYSRTSRLQDSRVDVYLFWGDGCIHCEEEKRFLAVLSHDYPDIDIRELEVLHNNQNLKLLNALMNVHARQASAVPITFIGNQVFEGFLKTDSRCEGEGNTAS